MSEAQSRVHSPQGEDALRARRRRKAILAGGVVLGLGAVATLAAWSDEVFADGDFYTGSFELEGASDLEGDDFRKWDGSALGDAPDSAPLLFNQTAEATLLSYDEPVYAPLQIRLSEQTGVDGTYVLDSVRIDPGKATSPLRGNLDYDVYAGVPAGQCSTGNLDSGELWLSGSIDDSSPAGAARSLERAAGTTDNLCLGVTLTSNDESVQGVSNTTIEWHFSGTQTV